MIASLLPSERLYRGTEDCVFALQLIDRDGNSALSTAPAQAAETSIL